MGVVVAGCTRVKECGGCCCCGRRHALLPVSVSTLVSSSKSTENGRYGILFLLFIHEYIFGRHDTVGFVCALFCDDA